MYKSKRYLITSALPYANGPLHIGHLAGAYLNADIFVRFLRLMKKDVVFVCGSDENGAAITMRAKKENSQPKEIIDKYNKEFITAFDKIGISFDVYHRTSSEDHHETAKEFFLDLHKKGVFEQIESDQYYDEEAKQFLADRYIKGTCPKCNNDDAYGDQCEKCGSTLSPTELINPVSTLTKNKPVLKKTKHWYLPLNKDEGWLREFIEKGTLNGEEHHEVFEWKNHVIGQCKSWLDSGLQPRAMTRDLEWGVDVPQEIEGAEGKKLYVWMDAPIGYISATKHWAKEAGKDWKKYWQDEDSTLIHFIGKDNIVFHCIVFPAILKAKGGYNLPKNVPANQFMNLEGDKISTSKNWAVWVNDYIQDFPDKIDNLRYNLTKNMPELKDSEFTWKGFQDTTNNELVNNLGNFVNRVLVLTNKYYKGIVPEFDEDSMFEAVWEQEFGGFHETELLALHDEVQELNSKLRNFNFRGALSILMDISAKGNQLLQFNEPWRLVKEDPEKVKAIMNLSLQIVTVLSVITRPFMPFTSDKLREMLGLEKLNDDGELLTLLDELSLGNLPLETGHKINKAEYLFSNIDDKVIEEQVAKLKASTDETKKDSSVATKMPVAKKQKGINGKAIINFDDFTKMDIRTGTIIEAEKIEKADKLLKIKVDLGSEQRTVASGIAQYYKPNEIIGTKVLMLTNLQERKIRGVKSQGMILMAEDSEGNLSFVNTPSDFENGSVVR